jgi:hypothetical protein
VSIISCPECNKKISSHAAICSHCGFQFGDVSEEDLDVFRARKLRDRIYRLNMISYAVITVFVAAFGWYWLDSKGFSEPSSTGPFILMGLAAMAYLVVRWFLFRSRQKKKALRQKRIMGSELRRNL